MNVARLQKPFVPPSSPLPARFAFLLASAVSFHPCVFSPRLPLLNHTLRILRSSCKPGRGSIRFRVVHARGCPVIKERIGNDRGTSGLVARASAGSSRTPSMSCYSLCLLSRLSVNTQNVSTKEESQDSNSLAPTH